MYLQINVLLIKTKICPPPNIFKMVNFYTQVENFKVWSSPWTCVRITWGHTYLLSGHRDVYLKCSQKSSFFLPILLGYN